MVGEDVPGDCDIVTGVGDIEQTAKIFSKAYFATVMNQFTRHSSPCRR